MPDRELLLIAVRNDKVKRLISIKKKKIGRVTNKKKSTKNISNIE